MAEAPLHLILIHMAFVKLMEWMFRYENE